MEGSQAGGQSLLAARVQVPEHVVYRDFGDEAVLLNLESGMYHGVNRSASLMLSRLGESPTVAAAIDRLVEDTGQPRDVIESDVIDLCGALAERGLIERDDGGGGG